MPNERGRINLATTSHLEYPLRMQNVTMGFEKKGEKGYHPVVVRKIKARM